MSKDASRELSGQQWTESVASDAEEFGNLFLKHLEIEYSSMVSQLPRTATWADCQRAMMMAVVKVLEESGGQLEEIPPLVTEVAGSVPPVETNTEWNTADNARRTQLIDKWIQRALSTDEAAELEQLTERLRVHHDTEEMVPLEGARRLHRRLMGIDGTEDERH